MPHLMKKTKQSLSRLKPERIKMIIRNAKSIQEYKEIRANRIQMWLDSRFYKGSVTWEINDYNSIKITDKTGDNMVISLDEIA